MDPFWDSLMEGKAFMGKRITHSTPLALGMLLLLAMLATMGVGYSFWSDELSVNGVVQTGEVDARWSFVSCAEFYPWPGGGNSGEVEGKDIGNTTALIDPSDDRILHITVKGGYPSYSSDCQVHYAIEGSIPIYVRGTTIIPGENLTNCELSGDQSKTLSCDQMTVKFVDGIGSMISPGDEMASSLMLHVEQAANESTSYGFEVGLCVAQWNGSPTAEECFAASQ
jgi:hypothetical protein